MKARFTEDDLKKLQQEGKIRGYRFTDNKPTPQKTSKRITKYGNKKVMCDGHVFDSKKEAKRYKELLLLLKAGEIGYLELQVPYELNEGGTHSLRYIADFVYVESRTGQRIVEDAKGYRTTVYKKKKRLMKKVHGIEIKES